MKKQNFEKDIDDARLGYCPNIDCYYKQLLRKEQECERLKEGLFQIQNAAKSLSKQFDLLSAENEVLKNFHINLVGVKECEIRELVKLKQTLTEIKEIANKFDYWNSNLSQASETLHEIIEKISEVEDV